MSLTKIALIGANGHLGPSILHALQTSTNPVFTITVLNRKSSKSRYPASITTATIPDNLEHDALVSALTGHDCLIIAISGSQTSTSLELIAAASAAGIQRIIPADFGSCDSSDPRSLRLIPLYPEKKRVRDHLIALSASTGGKLSWTSIVCGHFLDYGLRSGLLQIWTKERRAVVFDGGDVRFSASMLRTVGEAVVGVLRHSEETRDRVVYVQSVSTTQNELLRAVERVVGGGDGGRFGVEERGSDEFIAEMQKRLKEKPGDHQTTEDLVGVEGIVNADWMGRKDFVNGLLGLPEEDLDALVRESLEEVL